MLTAVVGINWGDEGKGRMVDLFAADYDIVCRYQGGNNAGHTVVNDKGKFVLNLLPSGILHENTVNTLGNGMVVDIEHFYNEVKHLTDQGIHVGPDNLKVSDKAIICMPFHKLLDVMEESRLADKKYGSTGRGIGPVYADKYIKKGIRMEDLFSPNILKEKINGVVDWKNLTIPGYGHEKVDPEEMYEWAVKYGEFIKPYITDVTLYLRDAMEHNKNIMFEAQLGALRDIDFGIYPYTSSSCTLASYAPIGSGIPFARIDKTIGIMKAYSTCVGEGPFVVEMSGKEADDLRTFGFEYGAATGRPRRVGAFDIPASRYGVRIQGADEVALTKIDVLSYMDKIPVCVAYDINGEITKEFPSGERLLKAKPVYEYMDGFGDITKCRHFEELPETAKKYVRFIEKEVGCKISYISVGPGRDEYIKVD